MTLSDTQSSSSELQLAHFGEFSRCVLYAPGAMAKRGFVLLDSEHGGLGVDVEGGIPEWLQFVSEVRRWRFGSASVGIGAASRSFGLSDRTIVEKLSSVGLTYDDISGGARSPRVTEVIEGTPWLWGYSQKRESLVPSPEIVNQLMMHQASALGFPEVAVMPVDIRELGNRIESVVSKFDFRSHKTSFGMSKLFYRDGGDRLSSYLGIRVLTDKRIPFPTAVDVKVMPDIDFVGMDYRFKNDYESGSYFGSFAFLGLSSFYMRAYTPQLLDLTLCSIENALDIVLPLLVEVCDGAPCGVKARRP